MIVPGNCPFFLGNSSEERIFFLDSVTMLQRTLLEVEQEKWELHLRVNLEDTVQHKLLSICDSLSYCN